MAEDRAPIVSKGQLPDMRARKARSRRRKKAASREARERYEPQLAALIARQVPMPRMKIDEAGPVTIKRGDEVEVLPAYDAEAMARILGEREPISPALRLAVLRRDRYRCRYCGKRRGPFHLDHVVPFILGGPTTLENLVTACRKCNLQKGMETWTPGPVPM